MSDISVSDDPFEVRDAGNGKGLGCFATRDIKAGETVLVTYTPITWTESRQLHERVDGYIDVYNRLDEYEKQGWAALAGRENSSLIKPYAESLTRQRPDGSFLTKEQQETFVNLLIALENNCFDLEQDDDDSEQTRCGLFLKASRFNHSCDPNVTYVTNDTRARWVGRATRDISAGDELLISYVPTHRPTEQRQKTTQNSWGFLCDCPKCSEGLDTYTTSLLKARDITSGIEPGKTHPPAYRNDIVETEGRIRTRIKLLRETVAEVGDTEESKWRRRQLAFALWDASEFHRMWFMHWGENGDPEQASIHITQDREYCLEALSMAKAAWPKTNEMLQFAEKNAQISNFYWIARDTMFRGP
ncbi:hypothetical protein GGS24DRAFT_511376 [Hypoxylon argillaceum]|nr:hypothetical protein GGS24DRAFT_511376 [Hypoxylon argillaceum]